MKSKRRSLWKRPLETYRELGEVLAVAKCELYLGLAALGLAGRAEDSTRQAHLDLAAQRLGSALEIYERYENLGIPSVNAELALAAVALERGEWDLAEDRFQRLLSESTNASLDEETQLAELGIARIHIARGDWSSCVATLARRTIDDASPILRYQVLARCHYELGDAVRALHLAQAGKASSADRWRAEDERLLAIFQSTVETGSHQALPAMGSFYLTYLESRSRAVIHR